MPSARICLRAFLIACLLTAAPSAPRSPDPWN